MTELRKDLDLLVDIQVSMDTINKFIKNKENNVDKLSDVWNTLLDLRENHLKNI